MGLLDRLRVLVASIYIEPAVFLFYICYGIFFVTSQQLYIEKACKVNLGHNATVCDNLADHDATQLEAQKLISVLQVGSVPQNKIHCSLHCFKGYNGALQSLPTIFVAFFAGPLSDIFSRKPLILISLAGYVLLNVIFMVNVYWFYELKVNPS